MMEGDSYGSNDTFTTEATMEVDPWKPFSYHNVYIGVCAFGVPGNVLTIFVLLSSKQLREKPINLFMVHQSLLDSTMLFLTIMNKLYNDSNIVEEGITRQFFCRVWTSNALLAGLVHSSGYNLMFLTIERYWAITKPLSYDPTKVMKRLPIIFVAAWLIGIASMFPKFATTRSVDGKCLNYYDLHNQTIRTLLSPYYISIACIIPALVMFYAYGAIWFTLRKSRELQSKDTKKESATLKSAQMNLLQTCIILMALFVVSWFQHAILFLLLQIRTVHDPYGYAYHGSVMVLKVNNCLNPFVYTVRYKSFQAQLKTLFCRVQEVKSQMTLTSNVSQTQAPPPEK